jgi:predicted ATPase
VLGREFGYDLIEQVTPRPAAELRLGLERLAEAGLLFSRGVAPQSSYLFKHALVQDAAYGRLLRVRRQAKVYELRAATSLARLSGERGKRGEARELLAPVYGWFTEGFDTADLKHPQALLDQLA